MNEKYLENVIALFSNYKDMGMKAMEQVGEESLFYEPAEGANSIAVIVKHLHGNMLSRWTDFLTTDGEKEWRRRDDEFENSLNSREAVYSLWENGWECLFSALRSLSPDQLSQTVHIRGEAHTVLEAINRQLCHYISHVGQIVYLGKIIAGPDWKSLSIAKGQSAQFNKEKFTEKG